ncbi:prepilin peptidase [Ruegeria atlantica]|uniref:prepilin peptidase n=1 Tax=Ruegeria atlantica TaxID=81569 RepID=UPI00147B5148|nr:prepilin peptidase [Ruegeria atlantica]
MNIPATAAVWFLPFVLPICFYVALTDLREMKIKNHAVSALLAVFVVVGLFVLPPWSTEWSAVTIGPLTINLPLYVWHLLHIVPVFFVGILFNVMGAMGAGDVKFMTAASPFIWPGDYFLILLVLATMNVAAWTTHRLARASALQNFAPDWESWNRKRHIPMGLSLGGSLTAYLILGTVYGS